MAGSAIVMPKVITNLTLLCLLAAAFTSTWGGIRYLPVGQIGDAFLALTLALIIGLVIFGNLRFRTPAWIWIAPIAVVVCLAIRWMDPIPWSEIIVRYTEPPFEPNNFPKAIFWLIALIAVPVVIIGATALNPRTPRLVMAAFTAGICVSALVSITDLLGISDIAVELGVTNEVAARQSGLTVHSVMLGLTCVLAIPFALYFIFTIRHKWIPALGLLVLFGGVLASGSRGCQAASVLVLLLSFALAPNKRDRSFKFAVAAVAVAAVALVVFAQIFVGDVLDQLFRFGEVTNIASSDQSRSRLAQQAIEDFQKYSIAGLGLKAIVQAHSLPLQLLQSGGLILFVSVVTYWIWCLRDAWVLSRRGHTLARYLFVSIFAWLALGVIENQLTDRLLYYTVGCVAALSAHYLVRGASGTPIPEGLQPDPESAAPAGSADADRKQLLKARR